MQSEIDLHNQLMVFGSYLAIQGLSLTYVSVTDWLIVWCLTPFQQIFSYIAAASSPVHAFLEIFLPVLCTILFPSHCRLSHIIIAEKTDNGVCVCVCVCVRERERERERERGDIGWAADRTSDLLFSRFFFYCPLSHSFSWPNIQTWPL